MCNQAAQSNQSTTGPPFVKREWGTIYMTCGVLAIVLCIISAIVLSQTPACSYHSYSNAAGRGYYYPERVCYTTYTYLPAVLGAATVVVSLNFAGVQQLLTKSPVDAGSQHFCCMFTWAIILAGNALFWLLIMSIIASYPLDHWYTSYYYCRNYYSPYYGGSYWGYTTTWYSSATSMSCSTGRQLFAQWKADIVNKSRFGHGLYAFSCWLFVVFLTMSIVLPSQVKYWCTTDCKNGCQDCARPSSSGDDSCACHCCLYAPGQGPPPKTGGAVVAMVPMGGGSVPLAVNQGGAVMQAPMGGEVQFWLTNELGIPQYAPAFTQKGYTTIQSVMYAVHSDADLKNIAPGILPGHSALILSNLQAKRQQYGQAGGSAPAASEGGVTA